MLLFWLCGALVAAVIVWLLLEISSLQQENHLLRKEIIKDFERRSK